MGRAYEVIAGRVTNPGAGLTALTADTGDSFSIRYFDPGSPAVLENMWAEGATAGAVRIRSPRLHDNVQGIRARFTANNPVPLLPDHIAQVLYPQDNVTFEMSGGAAEIDTAFFAIYYHDLGGVDARLRSWEDVAGRIVNVLTQEVAVVTSATAGDWSPGVALNATFDLLKADTFYAILGYETDVRVGAVAVRGPDTGNLRVGGPGAVLPIETREFFLETSNEKQTPHIPVINSANKGATLLFVADPAVSAAVNVTLHIVELAPGLA